MDGDRDLYPRGDVHSRQVGAQLRLERTVSEAQTDQVECPGRVVVRAPRPGSAEEGRGGDPACEMPECVIQEAMGGRPLLFGSQLGVEARTEHGLVKIGRHEHTPLEVSVSLVCWAFRPEAIVQPGEHGDVLAQGRPSRQNEGGHPSLGIGAREGV